MCVGVGVGVGVCVCVRQVHELSGLNVHSEGRRAHITIQPLLSRSADLQRREDKIEKARGVCVWGTVSH